MKEAWEQIAAFAVFAFGSSCIVALGFQTIGSCIVRCCYYWEQVGVIMVGIIFFWVLVWTAAQLVKIKRHK